ncbi:GntR family transcriptional regulator [Acuticoccus sp. M5D2P5]|uniref:GntR family transcriptional regulator n=1 Tax=Acuticoccus kalidii TaxID=2910977 RepID=UPI001F4235FA|nr:GntR family transcriptional regulator [Acuticoccus kalidii]MCF3933989.1 GntR family transcriptional regulator [Acuticoccus kalidii]
MQETDSSFSKGAARQSNGWQSVAADVQADILVGRILPRERLIEDELIVRFGATRHAVRRALDELERLGLVVRRPNRGAQVCDYTPKDIEDLYAIRYALEGLAAASLPVPGDAGLLTALREVATAHQEASAAMAFSEIARLNNLFHDTLFASAGNEELASAIRLYALRTQPIRSRGFADSELRRRAVGEHFAMCDALERGERETLAALCREHIRWPMEFYLATIAPVATQTTGAPLASATGSER